MLRWLPFLILASAALGLRSFRNEVKHFLLGSTQAAGPVAAAEWRQERAAALFRGLPESGAYARLETARLLGALRRADTSFTANATVSHELEAEFQAWRRQWEKDGDRATRLQGQSLTEADMKKKMREILLDEAWLEKRLHPAAPLPEEVNAAYASMRPQAQVPPVYRVAHLFLAQPAGAEKDRQKDIQSLHAQLLGSPRLWQQLVARHSQDARSRANAGDLGWVSQNRMPAELMKAVAALQTGQTSAPVRSRLGWHLLRVQDKRPARQTTVNELGPELDGLLWETKVESVLKDLSGQQ